MRDLIKLVFQNLLQRKKRAALTMVGVFIGITAVVALVALGQGLEKTVIQQFEEVGADKVIIQAKDVGFGSNDAPGKLKEKELNLVEKAYGVSRVAGQLFNSLNVEYNGVQRTIFLISIPDDSDEVALIDEFNTWDAEQGRLLTHKDKGKAVVGYKLASKKLFGKNVKLRDKIKVGNETFKVVGLMARTGDPGMDGSVSLSEADSRKVLGEPDAFTYIIAQTAKGADPEKVALRIEKKIRKYRGLEEGKEDFSVQSATELIASFASILGIIQVVFVGIAAISLVVGGIGITNTMYTAVLERTREIGVMKAIGAKNSDILFMFLLESGALGLVGGLVGVVLGVAISKGVEIMANSTVGPGTLYAYYPWQLIVGVLLFSTITGMLSGTLPARRASKLKPVDALREE